MDLSEVQQIAAREAYLAVVATTRGDGSIQASVVNAGVLPHPVSASPVVAFVTYGRAKLTNLRTRPRVTIVYRSGWQWAAVEGPCELAGPDDHLAGFEEDGLAVLLRQVFTAAGGVHEDWDEFDRVMAADRRTAVLVVPERVYSNAGA